MTMQRVEVIVTTTHHVDAYGGLRLTTDALRGIAQAIQSGTMPLLFNHDAQTPAKAENVAAGVRARIDGEHEVWAEFDIDSNQWARFQAHLDNIGAPGGMSIGFTQPVGDYPGGPDAIEGLRIQVDADAHHFPSDEVVVEAERLARFGPVRVGEIFQLAADPPALVALAFFIDVGAQVSWGVLGNYVYDLLRRIRKGKPSTIHLEAIEGERSVKAIIPIDANEQVAMRAVEAFENVATSVSGTYVYDAELDAYKRI